jgi:hypothetical protein
VQVIQPDILQIASDFREGIYKCLGDGRSTVNKDVPRVSSCYYCFVEFGCKISGILRPEKRQESCMQLMYLIVTAFLM